MTSELRPLAHEPSRRRALVVLGAATAASAMVGACGGRPDTRTDGRPSDPDPLDAGPAIADGSDDTDPGPVDETGAPPTCAGGDVGAVDDYPPGWRLHGGGRNTLIIGHDGDGLFAMTGLCTHARCPLDRPNVTNGRAFCGCHGAIFGGNGEVIRGPSRGPLRHFALEVCDGRVLVDTGTNVDPTTRTPV